jgi:MFS family permease
LSRSERPLLVLVACHLLASFAVLGMAPYFAAILAVSFGQSEPFWAGALYSLPLLVMAVAGPLWGRFADRFGKRLSLQRAQLGLVVSLFACGWAPSVPAFAACLVLQGLFGGTFSASNALLAQYYAGAQLARALSFLQLSACIGLFAAPAVLGVFLEHLPHPQHAYRLLWVLPLLSFALLKRGLPPAVEVQCADAAAQPVVQRHTLSFSAVLLLEFGFTVVTVVTYPHFVTFFYEEMPTLPRSLAGLFFGMPHAVYLLFAGLVISQNGGMAERRLSGAFALFTVSMVLHFAADGAGSLALARGAMGVSMVYGYVSLARLVSEAVRPASAGRAFGWLDTASKFAGVLAGLLAGGLVRQLGPSAPFAFAACLGALLTTASIRLFKENR